MAPTGHCRPSALRWPPTRAPRWRRPRSCSSPSRAAPPPRWRSLIARHAPADAIVVSLQNGVGNVDALRARLGSPAAHRGRHGALQRRADPHGRRPPALPSRHQRHDADRAGVPGLREALDVPGAAVAEHADMTGVLWGKLLLNLNNALNALSGLPLAKRACRSALARAARRADRGGAGRAEGGRHPSRRASKACRRAPSRSSCACPMGCSAWWRGACWPSTRKRAPPCGRTCGCGRTDRDRPPAGRNPGAGRQGRRGGAPHRAHRRASSRARKAPAPARPAWGPAQVASVS